MSNATLVKAGLALAWLVLGGLVIGYPLVAGRIRIGAPGSEISRDGDPQRFWRTFWFSTGGFIVVSTAASWFVLTVLLRDTQ